jgi:hypothetical protein
LVFKTERDAATEQRREDPADTDLLNAVVVSAFEEVVRAAPAELRADTELMLADLKATFAGNPSKSEIDDAIAAAKRVDEHVDSHCEGS